MSTFTIRPFRRVDRDQVTGLINQHIGAVIPGCSVSVNAVLSQLEREPGEMITDPWIAHREAWVAEDRDSIVGAALLRSYGDDDRVPPSMRGRAEIRWLVAQPARWDADPAERGLADQAAQLLSRCVAVMRSWSPSEIGVNLSLPAPGVYGVPDVWPHLRLLLTEAGFRSTRSELIYLADIADLPTAGRAPIDGLTLRRDVGSMSTRFVGEIDGSRVGYIEVNSDLTVGGLRSQFAGIADLDNVHVEEPYRRRGVATWLLGEVADWLRLGGVRRVLNYADAESSDQAPYRSWTSARGWRLLTRTDRGWNLE